MFKISFPDINPLHIKCLIAKTIKDATGKGPIDTHVTMFKDAIVVKVVGHLPMADLQIAQNHNEQMEVKNFHHKRARVFKDNLVKDIEILMQRPVLEFFYDINPLANHGIIVFLLGGE